MVFLVNSIWTLSNRLPLLFPTSSDFSKKSHFTVRTLQRLKHEDGDSAFGLKGGSVNVSTRLFLLRDPLAIKSAGIESMDIGLSSKPKIIV